MSIKSHIENAEQAIRQAIVTALNEKQDSNLTELFELLQKTKNVLNNYPVSFNYDYWKNQYTGPSKFTLNSNIDLNTGEVKSGYSDYITFPSANSPDRISLGLD